VGTNQEKKKIINKIVLNLFLVFLILPLILELFPSSNLNEKPLGFRLIEVCFGNKQNNRDFVEFFNIGQGDCTLIKSQGSAVLIDCGIESDNNKIYNNLLKRDVKSLELAVITHHHKDHMGDFLNLAENMKIKRLVISDSSAEDSDNELYKRIIEVANKNGTEIITPKAGSVFKFGSATLKILSVNNSASEENDRSVVMMANIGDKNILFTGDLGAEAEQALLQKINLKCDILKLGHHGSANSSYTEFLRAASPKFAIVSCGYDNLYNHPADDALQRTNQQGIKVLRTDLDRNIRVDFNLQNKTFNVTTERGVKYVGVR
jgi:beta-lactamase superfamily II metal-dependent hydrolase